MPSPRGAPINKLASIRALLVVRARPRPARGQDVLCDWKAPQSRQAENAIFVKPQRSTARRQSPKRNTSSLVPLATALTSAGLIAGEHPERETYKYLMLFTF
jgi:hypothetical protein